MKGIEKITARIESDGKAETVQMLKEAEEKSAALLAGYKAKAEEETAAAVEAGKEAAVHQAERLESAAHMEAKKQYLAAKQACLDEAFAKAQKQLLALPDDKYAELLAKMAVKASATGKEEVLLNAKDRKRVGEQVVAKANELLRRKGKLTLAEDTRPMEGGLTLRSGSVEVNCAFETELRALRDDMASEIAAILFA